VELFIMLFKVALTFESLDGESLSVTIEMKATEQYFPVELFIMLYKVVPNFESLESVDATQRARLATES